PERRPILVGELFDRLKDDLLPSVEEKGLHLRIAAHSVTVYSDPLLLMEMLQNLLVNAVRYTRKGGVLLAARRSGSHVRLQVYDTGIGIPQDRLDDIFVEFVQVDDKVRRRQPGLGLGLAIVKRLGELLDHPVAVRSVEGRGTVAEVRVPLARRPGAQKHATAEEAAGGSSYRIAVIDNEPEVLDSMVLLLQALGHQPVPGGSAEDLVRALGPSAPDLILCNFELERGRCGLVEIQSLRNAMGIPELPAVLLTGDSSRDRREEARQSGFRLINKPVDAVHLARIIEGTVLNPRAGVYDEVEVR
ncbi:MAG: hypothetical protein KDD47_01685, partial [Acidobacteria bacterium]|nr:hypothetical protein [Acidobacteriota bacterium]